MIRELREEDAAAVAALRVAVNPHQVETAATVRHWGSRGIEREQWWDWVAELDGQIVASAFANFEWSVPTAGKGRFWIGVLPGWRRRGIGGALYEHVLEYLRERGARRARTWVDDDADGTRFVERRGFTKHGADRVSELDLLHTPLSEPQVQAGFRLVPLAEAREREQDLYAICAAGELDMPGDEPETELRLDDWRRDDYGSPALSDEASFVALAGEHAVSLAFLAVDPSRRLAYNLMTATLPEFRRRGLSVAVKLASARWAAANGYERIVTENDAENEGMLAVNRRLGYRHLYDQVAWLLEGERLAHQGG